jgi:hypothetical protein
MKIFLKENIFYFSKEKSSELSQVERSPTCIGADPGGYFTGKNQKITKYKFQINLRVVVDDLWGYIN